MEPLTMLGPSFIKYDVEVNFARVPGRVKAATRWCRVVGRRLSLTP
jgi:hypothetical protein